MADNAFSISIDLGDVLNTGQVITRQSLPRVREAVGAIAQQGMKNWGDAIKNAPGIWSEEKKAYASSLKWEYTGEFSAKVTTDYKWADQIESGRPPRDLKVMLNTSLKVRQVQTGKNTGKRYLIIPIQHNVPESGALAPSMPDSVYQIAQNLMPSRVTGMTRRLSGTGAFDPKTRQPLTVPQRVYAWGDRLDAGDVPGLSRQQQRRYQGMVRFDSSGTGGMKRSSYLTFRNMMEGSPGWVVPAKPGLHLVQNVVNGLAPVAEQVIRMAAQKDLGG